MTVSDVVDRLGLTVLTGSVGVEGAVSGGIVGDLLSYVLGTGAPDQIWITVQHHANVVAVAKVVGLAAVLLADGRTPDEAVLARAKSDGVVLLQSDETAFELSGRLHRLLTE